MTISTTVLQTLRDDYSHFPHEQTFSLYAKNVYFKDPMNEFRGRDRYQLLIKAIELLFLNCRMDLHNIQQQGEMIRSDWTLSWNLPLLWKRRIAISGWSELMLNSAGLIISHIDYWHCSRQDVLRQVVFGRKHPA